MFLSDLQQLTDCRRTLLPVLQDAERASEQFLDKGFSTVGLRALKSVKLQRAILLVGMFSILESAIQAETGWAKEPMKKLKNWLRENGFDELELAVTRFERVANTLKHGFGRSHADLKNDTARNFAVRSGLGDADPDEYVDIDNLLVDVTHELVEECADTIEQVVDLEIPKSIDKQL
ncbi:MAG: hypothetical protein AAGH43_11865 [Pseudomonadota bacterium]